MADTDGSDLIFISSFLVSLLITAIEAIRDAEIENLLSRLRLLRSCLKKEQLRTPVLQFFRENLPNLSVVKKEDDGIFEPEWKEKVGGFPPNNATGTNVLASLGRGSTLPSTDLGPDFSAQSFKLNLLGATQLPIPGSALETPYLGVQDTFQTPGVCILDPYAVFCFCSYFNLFCRVIYLSYYDVHYTTAKLVSLIMTHYS
ncbi:unnamed protein product [Spirodela intermedia]|uniref:Uncharacterized protein n=1 Tax=Spirodela intermedia TaxID=51605 RepID=A0A7I8JP04_SPIIN|nr:unnamed protein product [Spirodela intermedia]CAA6671879.1 unnamed protein product [Spirodela intermedia]